MIKHVLLASVTLTSIAAIRADAVPVRSTGRSHARPLVPVVKRLVRNGAAAHKPTAPVRIDAVPGAVLPGGKQIVRIVVTPGVDAKRIDLEPTATDGLVIASGPAAHHTFAAHAGQALPVDLVLAASGPGERNLVIVATLVMEDGHQLPGVASFTLNPQVHTLQQMHPGARVVRHPTKGRVIEIPADSPP